MKILQQLKFGKVAMQVAAYASALLLRIGEEALKRIVAEVGRLEVAEPNKTGQEKFGMLVDFIRNELRGAIGSVGLTQLFVTALVELFKALGLFQSKSKVNESEPDRGTPA